MHAYLIMAHNDFELLEKELMLLDDERNDIYIHIDKKVKNFDFAYYKRSVKRSHVHYVKRRNIQWGSYTIIETEMELFKAAYKIGYEYYHLLSGADLPIKSQDYIHKFFEKNRGIEFFNSVSEKQLSNYM